MKKLLLTLAIVALVAAPALAQLPATGQVDNKTYGTAVTVNVAEEVSMWAAANISLTLNGKNAENSDAVASTISHINNVAGTISVQVAGSLGDGAVNFFIFPQGTAADAIAAMHANANAPAGRVAFTLNGPAVAVMNVDKSSSVTSRPVVYAADAPNLLPDPDTFSLVVTWTIAPAAP